MEDIIVASRNKKKISELQSILRGFGMHAVARDDAGLGELLECRRFVDHQSGEVFAEL